MVRDNAHNLKFEIAFSFLFSVFANTVVTSSIPKGAKEPKISALEQKKIWGNREHLQSARHGLSPAPHSCEAVRRFGFNSNRASDTKSAIVRLQDFAEAVQERSRAV